MESYNVRRIGRRKVAPQPPDSNPGVAAWARRELDFEPDQPQAELLECNAPQVLLCCTRQWGKSTVTAVRAVHHALHREDALVVIGGPVERQSGELLAKAARFLARLGIKKKTDGLHPHSLVLPNGSRLVALPGTEATIRGLSAATFLIIDEAGKAPDSLVGALTPMLATTDGTLWVLATPNGQSGFFYEAWTRGEDWHKVMVPATQCPRITPAFLARERHRLGDHLFRQEFLCEFLPGPGQLFSQDLLDAAMDRSL